MIIERTHHGITYRINVVKGQIESVECVKAPTTISSRVQPAAVSDALSALLETAEV